MKGFITGSIGGIVPVARMSVVDALKPACESRPPMIPCGDLGVLQVELVG